MCDCVCPTPKKWIQTGWAHSFHARKLEIYLLRDLADQLDLGGCKELWRMDRTVWIKEKNCVVPPLPHSMELKMVLVFFFLMRLTREKRFWQQKGKGDEITERNLNFLIRKKQPKGFWELMQDQINLGRCLWRQQNRRTDLLKEAQAVGPLRVT